MSAVKERGGGEYAFNSLYEIHGTWSNRYMITYDATFNSLYEIPSPAHGQASCRALLLSILFMRFKVYPVGRPNQHHYTFNSLYEILYTYV